MQYFSNYPSVLFFFFSPLLLSIPSQYPSFSFTPLFAFFFSPSFALSSPLLSSTLLFPSLPFSPLPSSSLLSFQHLSLSPLSLCSLLFPLSFASLLFPFSSPPCSPLPYFLSSSLLFPSLLLISPLLFPFSSLLMSSSPSQPFRI